MLIAHSHKLVNKVEVQRLEFSAFLHQISEVANVVPVPSAFLEPRACSVSSSCLKWFLILASSTLGVISALYNNSKSTATMDGNILTYTQGNYATQNSSGMWQEDERAFVHCGSSGLNHAISSESATEPSKVSSVIL